MTLWKEVLLYGAGIALPMLVGYAGARYTKEAVRSHWYLSLKKAPFNPPAWLFPVVWTGMYTLMGTASVLVLKSGNGFFTHVNQVPLALYLVQLTLNGFWSPIFFRWQRIGLSVLWILAIDAAVALTTVKFLSVSAVAGYMFVPYLMWCLFATLLNYSIWLLNYKGSSHQNDD